MVDALEGVDEARDASLVERLQGVDLPPGGEGDSVLHGGVGGEDDELRVAAHDAFELLHEVGAVAAVVLDEHAAVLQVVHLKAPVDGPPVHAPVDDARVVRPRGGRVGVVGDGAARPDPDVAVAEGGNGARLVLRRAREIIDGEDDRHERARQDERGRAVVFRSDGRRADGAPSGG